MLMLKTSKLSIENLTSLCAYSAQFQNIQTIMMDREIDPNKPIVQTPRRTLGLRRITPRKTTTSPASRSNQQDVNLQTTPIIDKEHQLQTNEDSEFNTTKRRKLSLEGNIISGGQTKEISELEEEISQMKARLDKYEKYQAEKKEILQLIELWCNGGKKALSILQEEIQPEQDIEQILKHLNLPIDVFDFKHNEK